MDRKTAKNKAVLSPEEYLEELKPYFDNFPILDTEKDFIKRYCEILKEKEQED